MRVAVFGTGAVGGYFGGRLAGAGVDVHLIARGAQLAALREYGLRVRSVRGDFSLTLPTTDRPADIGVCDYVLFGVKSYDTDLAVAGLGPLLGDDTAVLSLQNGMVNEDKISAAIGRRHVLGAAAFILAAVEEPGLIVDSGGPGSLVFGEFDGLPSVRGERLLEVCEAAGIAAELVADIETRLWRKFAFICAHGGMTAATRLPIGEIRANDASWRMFRRLVGEVRAVAAAEGVDLPTDIVEETCAFTETLEPGGFSSLYYDLVNGRRLELEELHGFVIACAYARKLDTPMNTAIYALLKPHADVALNRHRR